MRRIRSIILTMMLILTTTLFCRVPVLAAANISVSVNKSNVKVGDTVTVTLSITSGYGAQGVLKKSSGVLGGSSDEYFTIGAGVGDVQRFSYKATSVGSCTFSIQEPLDDTTATRTTRTIPAAIPAMTAMHIKIMKTKRKRNPQTHLLVRLLSQQVRFPLSFLLRQRITQLQ